MPLFYYKYVNYVLAHSVNYVITLYSIGNFNPRPREEGDSIDAFNRLIELISIHALVKRATFD